MKSKKISRTGKKKLEHWINDFGVAGHGGPHLEDFTRLVVQLTFIFKKLEGRMSYRDLYEVAWQAGSAAVADLVTHRVCSDANQAAKFKRSAAKLALMRRRK